MAQRDCSTTRQVEPTQSGNFFVFYPKNLIRDQNVIELRCLVNPCRRTSNILGYWLKLCTQGQLQILIKEQCTCSSKWSELQVQQDRTCQCLKQRFLERIAVTTTPKCKALLYFRNVLIWPDNRPGHTGNAVIDDDSQSNPAQIWIASILDLIVQS